MHPIQAHDLARELVAARGPAARRRRPGARPAAARLRTAVGYRLVVIGWRLLDGARPRPA